MTTTPKPIKILKELVKRDGQDVVVTRGRPMTTANLAPSFFTQIVASTKKRGSVDRNSWQSCLKIRPAPSGRETCLRKVGKKRRRRCAGSWWLSILLFRSAKNQ